MKIKILTPESVIFDGEVNSVLLPGKNGEFHILNNHAAIVTSLISGKIKLFTSKIEDKFAAKFIKENDKESIYSFKIKSGVLEFSNNNAIILAE